MVWPFKKKKTVEEPSPEEERLWQKRATEAARQPKYALSGARGLGPVLHEETLLALQSKYMDTSALTSAFKQAVKDLRAVEVRLPPGATKPRLVGPAIGNYISAARMLDLNYSPGELYERLSVICNLLNTGLDEISFVTKQGIYDRVAPEFKVWQETGASFLRIQDEYMQKAMKIVSDAWKEESNREKFSDLHVFHDAILRLRSEKGYIKYLQARKILLRLNRALAVGLQKGDTWIKVTANPDLWKNYVQRIHQMVVDTPRLRVGYDLNNEFMKVNDAYKRYHAAYNAYRDECEAVNKEFDSNVKHGIEFLLKGIESGKTGNIVWLQEWLARDYVTAIRKATAENKNTAEFEDAFKFLKGTLDDLHYQVSRVIIETRKLMPKSDEVAEKIMHIKFAA
ncbi:hypothetical protein KY329_04090 [Candidatus Woesearchaeota archaeon]|nr:hypothetical protein [Candidatus Woesearchaeota archaeon]